MSDKAKYSIFEPPDIPCREISNPSVLSMTPLVSVKMITYNHELFIAKAIEGVIRQEISFPFELIIGEDCSTDRTFQIVLEYQKNYPNIIRIITSDQNIGMTKNNYRLEKVCRGKYIAYCEGDDYWHNPEKLKKQVDYLDAHPEVGLAHSDVDVHNTITGRHIRNANRYYDIKPNEEESNRLFESILQRKYPIRTPTVCVRKDLLLQVIQSDPIVFQSNRFLMGDIPRWLELSRLTKFKYIDESFATYNILSESASHTQNNAKFYEFYMSIIDTIHYFSEKYDVSFCVNDRISGYATLMLKRAYYSLDPGLASKTKELIHRQNLLQRLLYLGAVSQFMHYTFLPFAYAARYLNKIRRSKYYQHHKL